MLWHGYLKKGLHEIVRSHTAPFYLSYALFFLLPFINNTIKEEITTAKIEISIEPAVKDEFMTLLRNEGKTASVEIGLWIRDYIKNNKLEEEK